MSAAVAGARAPSKPIVSQVARCPTCGQRVGRSPLLIDIDANVIARGGKFVRVEPRVAEYLRILQDAYPKAVKNERIIQRIWGITSPLDPKNSLHQIVLKARRAMQEVGGWEVETIRGVNEITLGGARIIRKRHGCAPSGRPAAEARVA